MFKGPNPIELMSVLAFASTSYAVAPAFNDLDKDKRRNADEGGGLVGEGPRYREGRHRPGTTSRPRRGRSGRRVDRLFARVVE